MADDSDTRPDPVIRDRMDSFKDGTIQELVDWAIHRGLDPAQVRVTYCHLRFRSPETADEAAYRAEWAERQALRQEKYERTTYERLKVKFETVQIPVENDHG